MNDCFAALDQAFPGKKLSELFLRNERSPTQRTRLNIDEGATSERERERSRLPNWPAQFVTPPLYSVVVRQLPGQTEGRTEPDGRGSLCHILCRRRRDSPEVREAPTTLISAMLRLRPGRCGLTLCAPRERRRTTAECVSYQDYRGNRDGMGQSEEERRGSPELN